MLKKILFSFIGAFMILGLVGCGSNTSGDSTTAKVDTKGKCDVFECIKLIDINDNYSEVVSKIGFEGELKSENHYYWELSEDTSIDITFGKYGSTVAINYPNKLSIKRADFSKWDEIKSKVDSKEGLTYNELVSLVGGVEGTLDRKYGTSVTYKWLNADGGYLSASFDTDDMKCSFVNGWF